MNSPSAPSHSHRALKLRDVLEPGDLGQVTPDLEFRMASDLEATEHLEDHLLADHGRAVALLAAQTADLLRGDVDIRREGRGRLEADLAAGGCRHTPGSSTIAAIRCLAISPSAMAS